MKIRFIAILAIGLAAGCGQTAAPDTASQAVQPQAPVAESCAKTGFYSPIPGDLQVQFPFHLRSDRIFANKKGTLRRRVTLETLSGTAPEAFVSASQSLVAAGYMAKGKLKGAAENKQSQAFVQKGKPSIVLGSNVDMGKKPANPQSTGVVYFEWTLPGAKVASAPAAQ